MLGIKAMTDNNKLNPIDNTARAGNEENVTKVRVNTNEIGEGMKTNPNYTNNRNQVVVDLKGKKGIAHKRINQFVFEVSNEIANDVTLTVADKNKQNRDVSVVAAKIKASIDSKQDVDEIIKTLEDGNSDIRKQHEHGINIVTRKQLANEQLAKTAKSTFNAIEMDQSITEAVKSVQVQGLNVAIANAKDTIETAVNADEIENALTDGQNNIKKEHKAGIDLYSQKANALRLIDSIVAKVYKAVENDNSLSTDERDIQKEDIDSAVVEARNEIEIATSADEIEVAVTTGETSINSQYHIGIDLYTQKQTAKRQINKTASDVEWSISNDNTLVTAEKNRQRDNTKKAEDNAISAIELAKNADELRYLVEENQVNLKSQHQVDVDLDIQKQNAKDAIDKVAVSIKNIINVDESLTSTEKTAQKRQVDKVAVETKSCVESGTNAQSVFEENEKGLKQLKETHQSNTFSLTDQKPNAKDLINRIAIKIKNDIDEDVTLTDAQKFAQRQEVDKDVVESRNNIDAAQDAQKVVNEREKGIKRIRDEHQTNIVTLIDQKQNAMDFVDQIKVEVKSVIDEDETLKNFEKSNQKNRVDSDALNAKTDIDLATDAQCVLDAQNNAVRAIKSEYVASSLSLLDQKQSAKEAVHQAAVEVKREIDSDQTLSNDEKFDQKNKVDQNVKLAKSNIEEANDAQRVIDSQTNGINCVRGDYNSGSAIVEQKKLAKAKIVQVAKDIKTRITADVTLVDLEKTAQRARVDSRVVDAKDEVDGTNTAQGIIDAVSAAILTISNEYQPSNDSLEKQRNLAEEKISDKVGKISDLIDKDLTLNDRAKSIQFAAVTLAENEVVSNISKATNAQSIKTSFERGVVFVESKYRPNPISLDEQKQYAITLITAEAEIVKNEIKNDVDIDFEIKNSQTKAVQQQKQDAISKMVLVTSSQLIENLYVESVNILHAQHLTGNDLASQKLAAKTLLAKEVETVKDIITSDITLYDRDRISQVANVEAKLKMSEETINQSNSTDSLSNQVAISISLIDNQYIPGKPINVQKAEAIKEIEDAAASTDYISTENLSTGENKIDEVKIKQAVDAVVIAIKENINRASFAEDINRAKNDGLAGIAAVEKIDVTLDDHEVDESIGKVNQAISAYETKKSLEEGVSQIDRAIAEIEFQESKAQAKRIIKDHGEKVYNHLKYISDLSDSDKQSFREKVDRIVQTGSANIETVKSQSDILKIISTSQNSIDELDTNSVSSKFTEKENSDSKTLRKNSVNKIGSDSKAFSLNGSSPDNFTLPEANSTRKSKLIEKKLKHSAYFYNQEGKRANLLVAKRGSIVNTFGREMIKNREFYLTDNNLYIAAENFDPLKRILKKRSFLYDENGRRSGNSTLKKGTEVSTYGSPVFIYDKKYYLVDDGYYIKTINFGSNEESGYASLVDGLTSNAVLNHDALIYNNEGQQISKVILEAGSRVTKGETRTVNGYQFTRIGKNQYVASDNIVGTMRTVSSKTSVYDKYGNKVGKQVFKSGETVRTFGDVVAINGLAYFSIGNGQFISETAFE